MQNPFETGHIKNYLLLYASVVVIMILFFVASTLFHDVQIQERKEFHTDITQKEQMPQTEQKKEKVFVEKKRGFELLEKAY